MWLTSVLLFIFFLLIWAVVGVASQKTHKCGPGMIGGWLIPDTLFGVSLATHCMRHDDAYVKPRGKWKVDADFEFLLNILMDVREMSHAKRRIGYFIALCYFMAVFFGGWVAWWKCRWRDGDYLPWSLIFTLVGVGGVALCLSYWQSLVNLGSRLMGSGT